MRSARARRDAPRALLLPGRIPALLFAAHAIGLSGPAAHRSREHDLSARAPVGLVEAHHAALLSRARGRLPTDENVVGSVPSRPARTARTFPGFLPGRTFALGGGVRAPSGDREKGRPRPSVAELRSAGSPPFWSRSSGRGAPRHAAPAARRGTSGRPWLTEQGGTRERRSTERANWNWN